MSTIPVSRRNTIYADYQATTPVDPRVVEQMSPFWRESFGNPHSSDHMVGWRAARGGPRVPNVHRRADWRGPR